jgi:hypothetical protein
MAKVTYRLADSPDDPIYSGGFMISSHHRKPVPKKKSPSDTAGNDGGTAQGSEEVYLDLQNLPFDPATEFLRSLERDQEDE